MLTEGKRKTQVKLQNNSDLRPVGPPPSPQVTSVCPKELREGDVKEYLKEVIEMLLAYHEGRYIDITNERL